MIKVSITTYDDHHTEAEASGRGKNHPADYFLGLRAHVSIVAERLGCTEDKIVAVLDGMLKEFPRNRFETETVIVDLPLNLKEGNE